MCSLNKAINLKHQKISPITVKFPYKISFFFCKLFPFFATNEITLAKTCLFQLFLLQKLKLNLQCDLIYERPSVRGQTSHAKDDKFGCVTKISPLVSFSIQTPCNEKVAVDGFSCVIFGSAYDSIDVAWKFGKFINKNFLVSVCIGN